MRSRLLNSLDASIQSSTDRLSWSRALCREASHFARHGLIEQAKAAIADVRSTYGNSLEAEAAAWLLLSEGIINFSLGDLVAAHDRVVRGLGIADALNAPEARPSCAAWLAHIKFNLSEYSGMIPLLRTVLANASPNDHQARARAALVLADAFHFAGSFALARPWYDTARHHATEEGDDATISALLHNVAAFRATNARLAHALGELMPEEVHRATMEASSARSYDSAIGTRGFEALIPLLSGQLLLVDGEVSKALSTLQRIDVNGLPARLHTALLADLAFCSIQLASTDDAVTYLDRAMALLGNEMDADDAAYALCRLAHVCQRVGRSNAAADLEARAASAVAIHRAAQRALLDQLRQLVAEIEPRSGPK